MGMTYSTCNFGTNKNCYILWVIEANIFAMVVSDFIEVQCKNGYALCPRGQHIIWIGFVTLLDK